MRPANQLAEQVRYTNFQLQIAGKSGIIQPHCDKASRKSFAIVRILKMEASGEKLLNKEKK